MNYKELAMKSKVIDRKTGEPFNPYNFKTTANRSGTVKVSASERIFNDGGEMNADSKVEALRKTKALLDGTADGTFSISRQASYGISEDESQGILREAFADTSSEGFRQVGQQLLNPIKEIIDFEGVSRKFLAVRTVKAGETVRYDKDIHVVGHIIGDDGQTPQSVVEGRYIFPPEFEVSAYPSIPMRDIHRAQFDILQRISDKARQAIEYQEDLNFVSLAIAAATVNNTTSFFASLNLAAFEAMRYQIEQHRLICDKFLINRQEVSDMVNVLTTQVDPVTQRELIMAGYIGSILNADVITTAGDAATASYPILPAGQVLACADAEHLGGMPIRVELISEPTTETHEGRPRKGWYWWELIGQAIINSKGVSFGQKT